MHIEHKFYNFKLKIGYLSLDECTSKSNNPRPKPLS